MPWLDAGDTKKFEEHARRNVEVVGAAVKSGRDVVVPQPTCAYVLNQGKRPVHPLQVLARAYGLERVDESKETR